MIAFSRPLGGFDGASTSVFHSSIFGSVSGRKPSQPWADCCLSRPASATHSPFAAKYPARFVDSVLLPTPPFGFATTITVIDPFHVFCRRGRFRRCTHACVET